MNNISRLLLTTSLVIGFLFRVFEINYNGPFLDEAIYIVEGKKIFDGTWQSDAPFSWIGGMPLFYPTLTAVAFNISGIIGSRALNIFLCLISIFLIYKCTNELGFFKPLKLLNSVHGSVAAIILAFAPVSFWLSRLAIYDMLSITLFLCSLFYLLRAITTNKHLYYLVSGFILSFAFFAKYSVLLVLPFLSIAIFIILILYQKKYNAIYFFSGLVGSLSIYFSITFAEVLAFFTDIAIDTNEKFYAEIIQQFFEFMWVWYLLAITGIVLFRKKLYLSILLFALSLTPLIMHLVSNNTASVYQDTFFSLIFIIPLASLPFVILMRKKLIAGGIVTIVFAAILMVYSKTTITPFEKFWPDYTRSSEFLKTNVQSSDTILLEAGDTIYLDLYDKLDSDKIVGPYYFEYEDKEGQAAYTEAINDSLFSYIQLDDSTEELSELDDDLIAEKYEEVFRDEPNVIYKRK